MIIHSNLSKMKNKILPSNLQGNYRDSLGEFSNVIHVWCVWGLIFLQLQHAFLPALSVTCFEATSVYYFSEKNLIKSVVTNIYFWPNNGN